MGKSFPLFLDFKEVRTRCIGWATNKRISDGRASARVISVYLLQIRCIDLLETPIEPSFHDGYTMTLLTSKSIRYLLILVLLASMIAACQSEDVFEEVGPIVETSPP